MKSAIESPSIQFNDEDFISKLHDTLLIQILSLLPKSDANRTRILSQRWKNLWAFLPDLHFVMLDCTSIQQVNKFHDFIDQTLALRCGMPIQRFSLCCSNICSYNWVHKAIECNVQELMLSLPAEASIDRFCWDAFKTCSSLVSLTLSGEFVLHVPDVELLFPCLKKIDLESVSYSGDESIVNLISGCPVLEELFVKRNLKSGRVDNMDTFMVSSSSLKRLRFSFTPYVMKEYKVVIDAPKLEYLNVWDVISTDYSVTTPISLTEAHIKTRIQVDSFAQLVTCLSPVKILTLPSSTLTALHRGLNLPFFPNLIKFVVGIGIYRGWDILPTLLDSMPNLEHITFAGGLLPFPRYRHTFRMRWHPAEEVPACLHFKMKEIIIENRETVRPEEFDIISYMLKHSGHLETLIMNAHEIDARTREQILNFHRGSKSCQIQLV